MLIANRYKVIRTLGEGGFGTTYAATDSQTDELVAIKELNLKHLGDWKVLELFEREAQVLKSLDHPLIPDYVEFIGVEAERSGYLVQELAPGDSMGALLEEGQRFSEAEVLRTTHQLLEILAYLEKRGVVHRDIKPANIIRDADGTVRLVDFGSVRHAAANTMSSTVAGTYGYMAPEQLQGQATASSDLYGLGMTLIHMLTGMMPSEMDKSRLRPNFRKYARVSPLLAYALDRLVEPIPEDRFQTTREVLEALEGASASGNTTAISETEVDDPVEAMIRKRENEKRARERAEEEQLAEERALIARRRSEYMPFAKIVREGDSDCLVYLPTLRHWKGRFGLFTGAIAATLAVIFLGAALFVVFSGWHLAIVINVALWSGIIGVGSTVLLVSEIREHRLAGFHVQITDGGNFAIRYPSQKKPLLFGRKTELDVSISEPDAQREFGSVSFTVKRDSESWNRLSVKDLLVLRRFFEERGINID